MKEFSLTASKVFDNINFFKSNSEASYVECIQNIIRSDPFEGHKFYIHSFVKRINDATGVKVMYHHPRLTKPEPLPGTSLMRVDPRDPETATIIWSLPNQENFLLYAPGKMFADSFVQECINKYLKDIKLFMGPEEGDVSEEKMREIYKSIKNRRKQSRKPV